MKKIDFFRIYEMKDPNICEELIEYFDNNEHKRDGVIGQREVNKDIKESVDCVLGDGKLFDDYTSYLQNMCLDYVNDYPYSAAYDPWGITEPINIQRYKPNQGFYGWHTERTTFREPSASRLLVFLTYLNNIKKEGGETEFYHQDIKIKPKRGLTIIWPADWTFTHRGIPAKEETKYIATGWFNFQ